MAGDSELEPCCFDTGVCRPCCFVFTMSRQRRTHFPQMVLGHYSHADCIRLCNAISNSFDAANRDDGMLVQRRCRRPSPTI